MTIDSFVVLASGSPRRLDLLRAAGIDPRVRPADIDETPAPDEAPDDYVARLARTKAEAIDRSAHEIVIGADTVVVLGGEILGKPTDEAHARSMLRRLAGRTHEVLTGVYVVGPEGGEGAVITTTVAFRELDADEIAAYVATGEPADKAGAYALQSGAAGFVDRIDGDRDNVVGLPVATVRAMIARVSGSLPGDRSE